MKRLLFVIAMIAAAGCSRAPKDQAAGLFDDGMALLNDGNFAGADSAFRVLTSQVTTSAMGHYGLGLVLERQGQTFDALGAFLQVNKYDRTFTPALYAIGRAFRNLGENDLAATAFLECSALPDSPSVAIAQYAIAQCDEHYPIAALAALKSADTAKGSNETMIGLVRARAFAQLLQIDSAEHYYGEASSRVGKSAFLQQLTADYLESRGLIDSAMKASAGAVEQSGRGGYDIAYTHFLRALRNRYFWQARQTIDRLAGHDTLSVTYLSLRVEYGLATGDVFLASKARNKLLLKANNSITSYVYDADVCMRLGDNASVTANSSLIPTLAVEGADTSAFSRYLSGMLLVRYKTINDYAELAASLAGSSGWAADRRAYRLTYLHQFIKLKAHQAYEPSLKTIEEGHGRDPVWLSGIGDLWADPYVRNYDSAEVFYRRALSIDTTYAPAVANFTRLLMANGEYQRALAFYDAFPKLVAAYPTLAMDRATCLVQTGSAEQGSSAFQAALPKAKGDVVRTEAMSRLLEAKDRVELDGSLIRLLILLDEKNADALLVAATRDNDYGNYQSALETSERGLALEPGNVQLKVQRARANYFKGEKSAAKSALVALLNAPSGGVESNLYLSALMAADKDSLLMAQDYARTAHFFEMGSRRTVNNLAAVYLQSGRPDLAGGDISTVLNIHPDWGDTRYLYGLSLYFSGKRLEAKEYFRTALELGLPKAFRGKATELLAE